MINEIYNKDNTKAYKALQNMEYVTTESNEYYTYFNDFIKMLDSEKSLVRIRGFRMICSLAKWDKDNLIEKNIDKILKCFDDEVGVNIRQYLKYINNIMLYKCNEQIENKIKNISIDKYKSSIQSLIKKDIDKLLNN